MQPYPRAPDLVWPGHLHGTGCLSARAVGTGFPTVGLRLWLGPGCGWSWVLFTPARCGWGLGWVCLGSVCGVVPLLLAVCGVRGWALVWACFRDLCGFLRVSLAPRRFRFRCAVWAPGSRLCPALLGWVVGLCFLRFFFSFFSGCWVSLSRALWSLPRLLSFGLGCWLFFFFFLLVSVSLFPVGRCRWLGVAGLGWVVPLCLFGGPVFGALWVGGLAPFCVVGGRFGGCWLFSRARPPPPFFFSFCSGGGLAGLFLPLPSLGWRLLCGWCVVWLVPRHSWQRFLCATPRHSWLSFAAGGCGRSPPLLAGVCRRRWCLVCGGGVLVGLWLVCGVVGPSPLLAEVLCATPRHSWLGFASGGVGRAPPLLAGVRWRRCCVVCGVWRWCVGGVVAGVWCGWSLATPGGGSCVLLPATPGWVSLPVVVGGPRHSWLGSACGGGVWCVVCGVWRWCVGGVVAGVWCGWSLTTPGGGSCVLPPATPGWVSLPVVVGGPRHSWLGSACGGGVWCVVCGVWRWCVGGVVAGVWCGWSLATPGGGSCVLLPATLGWVSLPVVVGGPRHSWLGSVGGVAVWCVVFGAGVVVGLWLACGVVGPSPLLAEVPVCYSPPLLARFRCRWWWAVPATPGWGPLAAVVCGVWCMVCGGGVLVGLWLVCGVVGPSPLLAEVPVCYSPPLLAGFRCRWWWAVPATPGWGFLAAVVCGVLLGSLATPGGGSCVLLPATPGWVSLPLVVGGPRHSWLGSAGGGGVRVLLGRVGRAGLPGALWCASPFPLAALSFCFAWPPPGWSCPSLFRCCCRSSLAGVCGVWVGCCLAPVRVPWFFACCARSPGLWHPAAVAAWHLSVCPGCGRQRASLACLVAPRGAPRLVRSGPSRCSGRLSRRRGAFPHPGSLRPRLYWAAARGTRRPAENRALCACRWPPPRQGRWARSASYPFGAPRWGCPWRVPPASVLGCVRCGGWRVWTRSLTRPVSRTVRLSTGDSAGAPGLFRVDAETKICPTTLPMPYIPSLVA